MVVGGDENKIIHLMMDDERSEGSSPLSLPSLLFSLSPSLSPPRAKKKWQKDGTPADYDYVYTLVAFI